MDSIKLTKVFRSDKDKQGNPLMTQDGRPYQRLAVKAEQYGDKWISGFGNKANQHWKEGYEVEMRVEKVIKDGKEYLNFSMPSVWDEIRELKKRVAVLEDGKEEFDIFPKEKAAEEEDLPFD